MNKEDILKGNITIGEFLGGYFVNDDGITFPNGYYMFDDYKIDLPYNPKEWRFHEDYNLIMHVVEMIENTDCSQFAYSWEDLGEINYNFTYPNVEIELNKCWIYFDRDLDPFLTINEVTSKKKYENKIDSIFEACIEFCLWYKEMLNSIKEIDE